MPNNFRKGAPFGGRFIIVQVILTSMQKVYPRIMKLSR